MQPFAPNYSSHPPPQVIRREAADAASEAESWARELRRELEDARDEHEASADAREREYEERLAEWKEVISE